MAELMVEITRDNAQRMLIEESHARPVLIDFWADWCAPCKALMPILDKLVRESAGQVMLAKVNCDELQPIAQQFGVRSLPTVILMKDGQPVDGFVGALPEPQIRQFLDKHVPSADEMAANVNRSTQADGRPSWGFGAKAGIEVPASQVLSDVRELHTVHERVSYPFMLKGIFYAHMGWLFDVEQTNPRRYSRDLLKDPDIARISNAFPAIVATSSGVPTRRYNCQIVLASGSFGSSTGVESVTIPMTRVLSALPSSKMPIVLP